MKNRNNINIIIIESSYLIKSSLSNLIIQEFYKVEVLDDLQDFDALLSIIEKSTQCCILINGNILDRFKMYLHKIPSHCVIIPIFLIENDIQKFNSISYYININDDKRHIIETLNRAIELISNKNSEKNVVEELTNRETIILQLIAKGYSSKLIAETLNISLQTVSTHRKNISNKLEIKTVSGLTLYAIINNLISPEETNLN